MWNDAYKIGIDQIDQQHKQLIGALDDLLKCANASDAVGGERCRHTMGFLKDYAVNHFAAEEMLQQEIGFPEAREHWEMHQTFRTSLHEMELGLIRADYSPEKVREVTDMLTRWWLFHILKEDKKMLAWLPPQAGDARR
ncbi:hemerythrin family protein [Ruminococcaceae bacterium OttesenSCG-928-D13]|nr:hemerythrin family protein [Ruminococcaceae bacterium OttesenSCG-928-D13]